MLQTITILSVVVLVVLIWFFVQARSKDLITELMEKRRAGSRIVSRAEYVEGMNSMPVALSVTADSLYYENPDLQATFELARIDEIEYDDELATGKSVPPGSRALRLRSHGAAFEFVMPAAEIAKWQSVLPQRGGQTAQVS